MVTRVRGGKSCTRTTSSHRLPLVLIERDLLWTDGERNLLLEEYHGCHTDHAHSFPQRYIATVLGDNS